MDEKGKEEEVVKRLEDIEGHVVDVSTPTDVPGVVA